MQWHTKVHRDGLATRVSRAEARLTDALRELESLMDDLRDTDQPDEYRETAGELRANG